MLFRREIIKMAKEDLKRFQELLTSDADFQEKFRKAAEAYTGEKDEKSVFDGVLLPLAKEYGLSATYEEFKEYISTFAVNAGNELSEDELAQVAGGKGNGLVVCAVVGAGIGRTNKVDFCTILGWGLGVCLAEGATVEPN